MSPGTFPILTLITAVPLIGGILLLGSQLTDRRLARGMALGCQAISMLLALAVLTRFDPASGSMQLVERASWIPSIAVDYHLGIDGLGLLMLLLTALVFPASAAFTPASVSSPAAYHGLLLLLQAGLFGAFTAQNFIHWFLFWELSLIPAYFLVKLWGGPRRGEASRVFFIYTMVGSVTLLLSFLATYAATGSFDFAELAARGKGLDGGLAAIYNVRLGWPELSTRALGMLIFVGAFLGFAVKIPIWPFHTWLPLAYSEAPTPVTLVLTGAMSKLGVYGLLRILLPIFPEQIWWVQTPLLWLAAASVVMSALAAMVQSDLKRMMGYLSISHLGYCTLAIVSAATVTPGDPRWIIEKQAALSGAMIQMFSHGVIAAMLFGLVGWMEERSAGLRGLEDFGGLRQQAPAFAGVMGVVVFASIGLPGLSGFVGEFLIFKGTLALAPWAAVVSCAGLLITAIFLLRFLQKVWWGPLAGASVGFPDLSMKEGMVAAPGIAVILLLGLHPQLALKWVNATVVSLAERITL